MIIINNTKVEVEIDYTRKYVKQKKRERCRGRGDNNYRAVTTLIVT